MKLRLKFIPFIVLSIVLSSCGGNVNNDIQSDSEIVLNNDYYEFKGFSLKKFDIPAMIMLPDEILAGIWVYAD